MYTQGSRISNCELNGKISSSVLVLNKCRGKIVKV